MRASLLARDKVGRLTEPAHALAALRFALPDLDTEALWWRRGEDLEERWNRLAYARGIFKLNTGDNEAEGREAHGHAVIMVRVNHRAAKRVDAAR